MNTTPYDAELPFLAELERRVSAYARTAAAAQEPAELRTPPRVARHRQAGAGRALRRTAVLVALLCLLGASAFGARAVFFTSARSPVELRQTAPVTLASGRDGGDRWALRAYARGQELCTELIVLGEAEASRCGPPAQRSALEASSVTSPTRGYVFGLAGVDVRAISLRTDPATLIVATKPLGAETGQKGTPASTRYFVAIVDRHPGEQSQHATFGAIDGSGRRIGPAHSACLGQTSSGCHE